MSASGSEAQKSDVHRRMEEAEMEMNYLQWELTRVVAERDLVWRGDLRSWQAATKLTGASIMDGKRGEKSGASVAARAVRNAKYC